MAVAYRLVGTARESDLGELDLSKKEGGEEETFDDVSIF